jgi:AcrR family transcriptional regulator
MSPVKSRREQYSDATKAALLEAATSRFAEYGFAGTALEDVAIDIQATRGTVYHHFANKLALFQAVYEALEGRVVSRAVRASESAPDAWHAVLAALDVFFDHCCDAVYGRVVWQEAPIALGWERWKQCEMMYAYGMIETLVKRLIESGDMPAVPLEPTARVTFHILGAAGLALAEASEEDRLRVRDEYDLVIKGILFSVREQGPARTQER